MLLILIRPQAPDFPGLKLILNRLKSPPGVPIPELFDEKI
jgi:hypothetical protein